MEAQLFEIRIKTSVFWMVWFLNGEDNTLSQTIEIRPYSPDFKCVRFQIPTVQISFLKDEKII